MTTLVLKLCAALYKLLKLNDTSSDLLHWPKMFSHNFLSWSSFSYISLVTGCAKLFQNFTFLPLPVHQCFPNERNNSVQNRTSVFPCNVLYLLSSNHISYHRVQIDKHYHSATLPHSKTTITYKYPIDVCSLSTRRLRN
jgi:hypothetical protein